MKIFVINTGSSSIKSSLFDLNEIPQDTIPPVWEQNISWSNDSGSSIQYEMEKLLSDLTDKKIDLIVHRLVHGGNQFTKPTLITPEVKKKIAKLSDLAPLHNPYELEGIIALEELLKGVPQMALFDTAFHHDLPLTSKLYPGPYSWYEEGIQRYGFHGISYKYCYHQVVNVLKKPSSKMIICHLGSGASLCALDEGKSVNTSMGFTPLDGIMMGTRPGTLDPGILLYLMKQGKSHEELTHTLYHDSGLKGISQNTSDMKELLEVATPQSNLAIDLFVHHLVGYIGSFAAQLNGFDTLVFTAGIGENAPLIRQRVCQSLSYLDLELDLDLNSLTSKTDRKISSVDSKINVLLIHTQEAFQMAKEAYEYKMT